MDRKHPYTILYVEDEPKIREPYARLLSTLFEKVHDAADGLEAWRIYNKESPDIVVADIVLPKLDGLELLERIRRDDLRTRAILLTAFTARDLLLKATELDISNYLVKPVKKKEFLEALEKACRQLELMDGASRTNGGNESSRKLAALLGEAQPEKLLTRNETMFLSILAADTERYFTMEEIERAFYYEYDRQMSSNAIKALIRRLRKKLTKAAVENRFGHGYRLVPAP